MERPFEKEYLRAFDEYADALFRHARLRLKTREQATDLVQDAYIKTWNYIEHGGVVLHWKSFLYRTLNNLIIDEYRRVHTESLDTLLEEEPVAENPLLASGGRQEEEERLNTELLLKRIHSHFPELPESYRIVITLRYIDGFSPKEIAGVLELSENIVSVRIHRAVAKLKELCGPLTEV